MSSTIISLVLGLVGGKVITIVVAHLYYRRTLVASVNDIKAQTEHLQFILDGLTYELEKANILSVERDADGRVQWRRPVRKDVRLAWNVESSKKPQVSEQVTRTEAQIEEHANAAPKGGIAGDRPESSH